MMLLCPEGLVGWHKSVLLGFPRPPPPGAQATIGIDFLSQTMYLEDRTVRLQLWDRAAAWALPSLFVHPSKKGRGRWKSLIVSGMGFIYAVVV